MIPVGIEPYISDLKGKCVVRLIIRLIVLYILSVCKAEEGNVAVSTLTDDNAADGKIGSAISLIMSRTAH
jgi:hypothetical protein